VAGIVLRSPSLARPLRLRGLTADGSAV